MSRWELNRVLMDAAEESGCAIHFKHPVAHADANRALYFYLPDPTGRLYQKVTASLVFGADGGGSRCCQALRGLASETGEGDEPAPRLRPQGAAHARSGGGTAISSPSVRLSFSQSFNRADKIRRERRAGSLWRGDLRLTGQCHAFVLHCLTPPCSRSCSCSFSASHNVRALVLLPLLRLHTYIGPTGPFGDSSVGTETREWMLPSVDVIF